MIRSHSLAKEALSKVATLRHLLQEVSSAFALWAVETASLEELEDVLTRALVDNLPLGEEEDIIEKIECLRSGLEKRH